MRCVPVLILLASIANAAAPPTGPRLDVNGDPLPDGAVARLGTLRFQPPDPHGNKPMRWRWHSSTPAVALSPDGTTVAAATVRDAGGSRVDFLDATTGKTVRGFDLPDTAARRLRFTPDGKGLVVVNGSAIQVIEAATGRVARTIAVERADESALALSPDGKWVAAQPQRYVKHAPVEIWDTKTGKPVASLPGQGAACKGLEFGPGGSRLLLWSVVPTHAGGGGISFDGDSTVALACIDVGTRKVVGEATVGTAQGVALCPDGETVAIEAADHSSVRVRHLPTGTDRCTLRVKASGLAFTPDGKALFTIDEAGRPALWDARKGTRIRDLSGAVVNKDFLIAGFSKSGRTLAVLDGGWSSAARVVVWDAATGERAGRVPGHEGTVTCIGYAPGGKWLASGSIDRTVRLWDAATGKHLRVLAEHTAAVTALAFSPDGQLVASSCQSGATRVSRVADGTRVVEFAGPAKGATALAFSADGKVLYLGGQSPEVLARAVEGGKEVTRLSTGDDGNVLAFGGDGTLALTGNGEIRAEAMAERLVVWDLTAKRQAATLPIPDQRGGTVRCDAAIFSPGGRLIASSQVSEYEGIRPSYGAAQLRLWERITGGPIRTLAPVITRVLAFSPNGRLLAAGGAGRSGHLSVGYGQGVDVWDTLTGKKVGTLPVTPTCVAFAPDGAHLATAGRDHCVVIWEAPRGRATEARSPSAAEREAWWAALAGDAKEAYEAIGQMADAPDAAVTLLRDRVAPVRRPADPDAVARLIAQLDSEEFAEREKAERALEKMGQSVADLLAKALRGDTGLELRRRVERLLRKCNETSAAGKRHHRAVAVLEGIGTPAARALLRTLAGGAPGARLTVEARDALTRLER